MHTLADIAVPLDVREIQTGLNFSERLPELFDGKAMGEDALRVMDEGLKLRENILHEVSGDLPQARSAAKRPAHLPKGKS